MTEPKYALFDTPIGSCGIAWSDGGVVAIQLPEADKRATLKERESRREMDRAARGGRDARW